MRYVWSRRLATHAHTHAPKQHADLPRRAKASQRHSKVGTGRAQPCIFRDRRQGKKHSRQESTKPKTKQKIQRIRNTTQTQNTNLGLSLKTARQGDPSDIQTRTLALDLKPPGREDPSDIQARTLALDLKPPGRGSERHPNTNLDLRLKAAGQGTRATSKHDPRP
jgi:hypothetical protein